MQSKILFIAGLSLYTLLAAILLVWARSSFVVITAVLAGAPIFILWNRVYLHSHLVPIVAVFTILSAALVQLFAYKSGIWYEVSPLNLQVFGGAPVEAYLFSLVHILYFILLYEYFFDDKKSLSIYKIKARSASSLGLVYALCAGCLYIEPVLFVRYPFACLVLLVAIFTAFFVLIRRTLPSPALLKKALIFSCVMLPLSLVYEAVLLVTEVRLFANTHEYLGYLEWQGIVLPLEEILLLLLIPFCIVLLYELYLDDGK